MNDTSYPGSPFLKAALEGDIKTLKSLLEDKNIDLEQRDEYGSTALILATFNSHTEAVRLLIDHGADINAVGYDGNTALMIALSVECTKLLVESGANLEIKNKCGDTALDVAKASARTPLSFESDRIREKFLKAAVKKNKGPGKVSRIIKKLGF